MYCKLLFAGVGLLFDKKLKVWSKIKKYKKQNPTCYVRLLIWIPACQYWLINRLAGICEDVKGSFLNCKFRLNNYLQ